MQGGKDVKLMDKNIVYKPTRVGKIETIEQLPINIEKIELRQPSQLKNVMKVSKDTEYYLTDPIINLYEKYSDRAIQVKKLIDRILQEPLIKYKKTEIKVDEFKLIRELNDVDLRKAAAILFTPSFAQVEHLSNFPSFD